MTSQNRSATRFNLQIARGNMNAARIRLHTCRKGALRNVHSVSCFAWLKACTVAKKELAINVEWVEAALIEAAESNIIARANARNINK